MPPEQHDASPASGKAPEGVAGGESGGGKPAGGAPNDALAGGAPKPQTQFITPEILQGVVQAQKRERVEELTRLRQAIGEELSTSVAQQLEALKQSLSKPPDDDGKGGRARGGAENPEVVELKRQVDTYRAEQEKMRVALDQAKSEKREFRYESIVREALQKAACRKIDVLLPWIKPKLTFDEEKGRVFATVDGPYGTEELSVDDYIKRVVREETGVPELFGPVVKPGSPAAGDEGAAVGRYLFTKEQIDDPNFYADHAKEIRDALDKGLVKGVVRGK